MTPMDRFNRITRDIDKLIDAVVAGAKGHSILEPKLDAYRLKRRLQRIRSQLRREVFALEDALDTRKPALDARNPCGKEARPVC